MSRKLVRGSMRFIVALFSISFANIVFGPLALADVRDRLKGFHQFKFGITEGDIRKLATVINTGAEKGVPGGTRLKTSDKITIKGVSYDLSFLMLEGRLYRINLSNEETMSDQVCGHLFGGIFGLIQAKYGPPDTGISENTFGGISTIRRATFTFRDAGKLQPTTVSLGGNCTTSIAYTAGSGEDTF